MIHRKKGIYDTLRAFRLGTTPSKVSMALVFLKDARGCYSFPEGRIDDYEPKYKIKSVKMDRQDRVHPPRRKTETKLFGKIPLPRRFDVDTKYTLDFVSYVEQGYLELKSIVHPTMMFQNYGYRSSLLSDNHTEERRNYAKTAFEQIKRKEKESGK